MSPLPPEWSESVAVSNDELRRTLCGRVMLTTGVLQTPPAVRLRILEAVRTFDDFSPENDPYRTRDFGSFTDPQAGLVFWKIDYFDDPKDLRLTQRVLTIMLAGEY
jgi:hypothetical protein